MADDPVRSAVAGAVSGTTSPRSLARSEARNIVREANLGNPATIDAMVNLAKSTLDLQRAQERAAVEVERQVRAMRTWGDSARDFAKAIGSAVLTIGDFAKGGFYKASPSMAATLGGSWDMLAMSLGKSLIPAAENISKALQKASKFVEKMPEGVMQPLVGGLTGASIGKMFGRTGLGAAAGVYAGAEPGSMTEGLAATAAVAILTKNPWLTAATAIYQGVKPLSASEDMKLRQKQLADVENGGSGRFLTNWSTWGAGSIQNKDDMQQKIKEDREKMYREDPNFLQSYQGLPQSRITSSLEYSDRLQEVAMNQDPLQTELLRMQLEYLKIIADRAPDTTTVNVPQFQGR